jgi:hypothetical protein
VYTVYSIQYNERVATSATHHTRNKADIAA